jgi:hypothetical protein
MTDWFMEGVKMAVLPFAGWVISVERRLASLAAIKDTTERTDQRVEKIYDHLLESKNGQNLS